MSEFTHLLGSNPTTGAIPQNVVDYLAEALPNSGTSGSLDATGVDLGFVPVAQGDGTWAWAAGLTDHGALTGLEDDDHPQYLTEARGDARYDATGTAATLVGGLSIPTTPQDIGAQPAGDYLTPDTLPEIDLSGYVESTDPRLTDARPPTAHRHPWTDLDDVPVIPSSPGDIGAAPAGDYATNSALTAEAQARQAADSALSDAIALKQTAEQVDARVQQVVGTAPAALDTLGEIAERLADDADAVAALTSTVAGKADAGHNHDGVYVKPADLPDVSDVVREGDPRLTDDRDPTAHDHTIGDVTGLQAELDGKQPSGSYAPATHTHDDRYYTEGEVDTALAGKANTSHSHPEYAPAAQTINARIGSLYNLTASDAGKVVTVDNSTAVTVNVPASTFTEGQRVDVIQRGPASITLAPGSGMTLNGTPSLVTRAQWSAVSVLFLSATEAVVVGDLATP